MTIGTRRTGDFCWFNMLTPHPDAARAFFGSLLGWTYVEMPGMGHRVQVGGSDVGGLYDVNGPNTPPGTRPEIGLMVKVDDADATCKKVIELGGTSNPAFDIMNAGRMAVCADPTGAKFDLWQPKQMAGFDVDSRVHGSPTWFESLTSDMGRATTFYSQLFGWTSRLVPMGPMNYTTFANGGEDMAGMMAITPEMGVMPSHWGTYFTVTNADESARQTVDLGGTLMMPVQVIQSIGRFCGVISPQGIMCYLIEYDS